MPIYRQPAELYADRLHYCSCCLRHFFGVKGILYWSMHHRARAQDVHLNACHVLEHTLAMPHLEPLGDSGVDRPPPA